MSPEAEMNPKRTQLCTALCAWKRAPENTEDLKPTIQTKPCSSIPEASAETSTALCNPARSLLRDYFVELREIAFKKWLRRNGNSWDFLLFCLRAELSELLAPSSQMQRWKINQVRQNRISFPTVSMWPAANLPGMNGGSHPTLTHGEMGRVARSVFSQVLHVSHVSWERL